MGTLYKFEFRTRVERFAHDQCETWSALPIINRRTEVVRRAVASTKAADAPSQFWERTLLSYCWCSRNEERDKALAGWVDSRRGHCRSVCNAIYEVGSKTQTTAAWYFLRYVGATGNERHVPRRVDARARLWWTDIQGNRLAAQRTRVAGSSCRRARAKRIRAALTISPRVSPARFHHPQLIDV